MTPRWQIPCWLRHWWMLNQAWGLLYIQYSNSQSIGKQFYSTGKCIAALLYIHLLKCISKHNNVHINPFMPVAPKTRLFRWYHSDKIIWKRHVNQKLTKNSPSSIFTIYAQFLSYFPKYHRSRGQWSRKSPSLYTCVKVSHVCISLSLAILNHRLNCK